LTVETENPKVTDLLPLSREIRCDDTLREFHQVIRFDVIYGRPLRIQLLLDRRHKTNKRLSKPAAYYRMSSTDQLIRLGSNALATATVLAFFQQNRTEPSFEEIDKAVDSLIQMVAADAKTTVQVVLNDIKLRRMAEER
jgi:hypothetical protein